MTDKRVYRRGFLKQAALGLGACMLAPAAAKPAKRRQPNIVILFADDLGYGELGCQGNTQIPTPHIDSIAANGIRFTDGYVTAPYCSPSRAGMMSGRYQHRFGYTINVMPHVKGGTSDGLPRSETTLGEYLKGCGYTTGAIGKWHLGASEALNPVNNGFDYFYGFAHEGHYFVPKPYKGVTTMLRKKSLPDGAKGRWTSPDRKLVLHDILGNEPLYDLHNPILRGLKTVEEPRYLTDALTDEAAQFIKKNKSRPFLLYLAYNAVHSPLQGADKYMKKMGGIKDIQRRIFAAMLSNLDDSVGTVLKTIRQCKLEEDTLIFFLSDNGGPTKELTSSNLPLRGGKGSLTEGGVRIPFMVQWKSALPSGKVYRRPVSSLDIYATAAKAAGRPAPPNKVDGVDLIPYLTGVTKGDPHRYLYWRRRGSVAMRAGDWKILKERQKKPWRLYNLAEDISESKDLSATRPEKLKELLTKCKTFERELKSDQQPPKTKPPRKKA
ncbi:MAG: sulfatase-like hydrolase/transferase [Phycisphaerales bacterium]|jgi:arylsulfatase A-like enzyme|nr:sulfatase-like hydrolase/transferase [Phycisphaerales bacterium]